MVGQKTNKTNNLEKMKKVTGIFILALLGGLAGSQINQFFSKKQETKFSKETFNGQSTLTGLSNFKAEKDVDFTVAAEMTVHGVVHVKSYTQSTNYGMVDPFEYFFRGGNPNQPQTQTQTAFGSGVIISNDGYIVTNNHVINHAQKIEVTLNNKVTYEAKLIGADPTTDLALLKIDASGLPFVSFGNSDQVKVGEWVLAVGNPFNLASTVTAGIVSAKGRNINILESDPSRGLFPIESFIQTDAAVNPGNSGGALVNTSGQLIGINTAIASNTGNFTGYSFAIPVNIVQKVANDLSEFGQVQRAFLGASVRDIDSKLAKEKDIKEIKGVYVAGLVENGSAADAGIKEGDILTKIGEININTTPELLEQVGKYRPGDKINVSVVRNNSEKIISVILKNKNGSTDVIKKEDRNNTILTTLGATLESISNEERSILRINGGAKVTNIKTGKLKNSGIKEGFIITKIDSKDVNSPEEAMTLLESKKGGVLIEGIYPNGMRAYYGFGI